MERWIQQNGFWPTFSSTSLKRDCARKFAGEKGGIIFEIHLSKNDPHPHIKLPKDWTQYPIEDEILILPYFAMRLISRKDEHDNSGDYTYIVIEQDESKSYISLDEEKLKKNHEAFKKALIYQDCAVFRNILESRTGGNECAFIGDEEEYEIGNIANDIGQYIFKDKELMGDSNLISNRVISINKVINDIIRLKIKKIINNDLDDVKYEYLSSIDLPSQINELIDLGLKKLLNININYNLSQFGLELELIKEIIARADSEKYISSSIKKIMIISNETKKKDEKNILTDMQDKYTKIKNIMIDQIISYIKVKA